MALAVFEGATLFLLYLAESFQSQGGGIGGFFSMTLPPDEAWNLMYYSNMIIVILSSFFVSKVVRGKVKYYADYFLLFMLMHVFLLGLAPLYFMPGYKLAGFHVGLPFSFPSKPSLP